MFQRVTIITLVCNIINNLGHDKLEIHLKSVGLENSVRRVKN
jgi:hypothetical protein